MGRVVGEPAGFIFAVGRLALVHRAVRQLRRGHRRGARQGPGGQPPAVADRGHGAADRRPRRPKTTADVPATDLAVGDLVMVRAGDVVPADGDVVEGVASVDESAITGESAPVVRESGGDRSAVTGGTRVISDWLVVQRFDAGRARASSTG